MIENFRSGIMERFGLGYETWCQSYPGLIYCAISGYGRTGSYKDRAGYDVMVSALGGLMSITGTSDGAPVKTGVALTDVIYWSQCVLRYSGGALPSRAYRTRATHRCFAAQYGTGRANQCCQ